MNTCKTRAIRAWAVPLCLAAISRVALCQVKFDVYSGKQVVAGKVLFLLDDSDPKTPSVLADMHAHGFTTPISLVPNAENKNLMWYEADFPDPALPPPPKPKPYSTANLVDSVVPGIAALRGVTLKAVEPGFVLSPGEALQTPSTAP